MRLKTCLIFFQPFLSGFLGAAVFVFIYQAFYPSVQIGSVNVNRLVQNHIKARAHSHLSSSELEKDSQAFMSKLERALQILAQKNHLCLIVSEAVIVGSKDYTEQLRQQLGNGS